MPKNSSDNAQDAAGPPAESGTPVEAVDQLEFEAAAEELEALVEQMETGDLSLEASLVAYERGVKLARHCQAALKNAELKVSQLSEDGTLEPMDPDALDED